VPRQDFNTLSQSPLEEQGNTNFRLSFRPSLSNMDFVMILLSGINSRSLEGLTDIYQAHVLLSRGLLIDVYLSYPDVLSGGHMGDAKKAPDGGKVLG
jgi:hypothetical protein